MLVQKNLSKCICIALIVNTLNLNMAEAAQFTGLPVYPNAAINNGAGRFGEGRGESNPGLGSRMHLGVDMNAGFKEKLYAVADGQIIASRNTGRGGGLGTVLKPNNMDAVAVYWHQQAIDQKAQQGMTVTSGQVIGYAGNTRNEGQGSSTIVSNGMAVHLHFGVGVPKASQSTIAWLNNRPTSQTNVISQSQPYAKKATPSYGGKVYYWTNPAPFLKRDTLIVTTAGNNDKLYPYLGNSIRSQYNALTGAHLPLGPGAFAGSKASLIPKIKVSDSVGYSSNTETAQMSVVNAVANGATELEGSSSITPEELAYYAPPRTIFGGDSEVPLDVGDGNITKIELIDKIGTSRFGNSEWQKQVLGLSMRGMLIEYLNAINAQNFLDKEILFEKERIESLYAAWTAIVAKRTVGGDLKDSLEKAQTAVQIPDVSTIPIENLYEKFDAGQPISSSDLSRAVTMNTSAEAGSCNGAYKGYFDSLSSSTKRELISLSLRLGYHPIDFLTMIAVESGFGVQQNIYRTYYTDKKNVRHSYAAGFIQLTPGGAGGIPYNKIFELYPATKSPILSAFGITNSNPSNASITAAATRTAHGGYLGILHNLNPKYEFAVYDAYFYSKNKDVFNIPASQKNMATLYKMVIGAGYKSPSAGYNANAQYDLNNDGYFSPSEAVMSKMFRVRRCQYATNEQILSNYFGLTNDDLKYREWSPSIKRLNDAKLNPTIESLKGNFGYTVSVKAKEGIS